MKNHAKRISSGLRRGWSNRLGHRLDVSAMPATFALLIAVLAFFGVAPAAATAAPPEINGLELNNEDLKSQLKPTSMWVCGEIAPNDHETSASLEYSSESESGPWSVAKEETYGSENHSGNPICKRINNLTPETKYYIRVTIKSSFGTRTRTTEFTTPGVEGPDFEGFPDEGEGPCAGFCERYNDSQVTALRLGSGIDTNGLETSYRFEYAESEGGPYTLIPGASGSISIAEVFRVIQIHLEGLASGATYYIRGVATNAKGTVTISTKASTLSGSPLAGISTIKGVTGTSAALVGSVDPYTYETHWRFEYETSVGGPWSIVPGGSGAIAKAEAGEEDQKVEASLAGLNQLTTYYVRMFAENEKGTFTSSSAVHFETDGPPRVNTLATHAIHGEALRVLGAITPDGYDTHYQFQYVTQEQYEAPGGEGGFARAESTPELDAGAGERVALSSGELGLPTTVYGVDLPGLEPGRTYRFRIVASSAAPGDPVVQGETQTLTVPAASTQSGVAQPSLCPNLQLRGGLSAQLPDCRAYELITPAEKEGELEPFSGVAAANDGDRVGEDGDRVVVEASETNWGAGQGPYVFSRTAGGWQMTAATPQPESSVNAYAAVDFSPDLSGVALGGGWDIAEGEESPDEEFKVGPPGGPYTTAVSVPRSSHATFAAASEDLGTFVLASEDRKLVPTHPSATTSGDDLYEYSEDQVRQTNVLSGGATIGSCGASIPRGFAESTRGAGSLGDGGQGSRHAVSRGGTRIFFEAVPGSNCGEPKDLYMRTGGAETLDIGAYAFLAANADGSKLLLDTLNGEVLEVFLYDTESRAAKRLFAVHGDPSVQVSEDFTAVYFPSPESLLPEAPPGEGLYRYDIASESLRLAVPSDVQRGGGFGQTVSSDGRYDYFMAREVGGVPGGAQVAFGGDVERVVELYRYDSVENSVECVSCASPFDPEPKQEVDNTGTTQLGPGTPVVSANGEYAFFGTIAALVPQDLDGEVPQQNRAVTGYSPSWDIYEWRREGVDGCVPVQGCVSLITPGTDGAPVVLLGTTASGGDVFFITRSQLVPQDKDSVGDVYDARIDGGFPTTAPAVECEGDACSTPLPAPVDATPSSFTFSGAGNLAAPPGALPKRSAKAKTKKRSRSAGRCHKGKRCVKRKVGRAKRSSAKSHHERGRR